MSDDSNDETGLVVRAGRAAIEVAERAPRRLFEKVRRAVDETIAPALADKARQLLLELAEPSRAERLQEGLASLAQFAMKRGFRADPNAELLFAFVDRLEERHSRRAVLEVVITHAALYEQQLLAVLLTATRGEEAVEELGRFRDRAGESLLRLVCSLAALETDEPPPEGTEARIAYFEAAPIEERFKPLAAMAAGRPDAFEEPDSADEQRSSMVGRLFERIGGETTALARFVPSLSEPATRFLTTSYLFFLQSYLVRAMVEELPAVLEMIAELEPEVDFEADEIVDIGD